jgi:hypothetical protein
VSDTEGGICLSGLVFSSVLGIVAILILMSSVTTSLLCLRMKTMKKKENDSFEAGESASAVASVVSAGTLLRAGNVGSSSRARKSEYVHSTQQRIP